jgi:geranylgeranyl reductase family protein
MSFLLCDVLIIGAGPAGSTAGLILARKNQSVLLVDQHTFPREKICGDGLAVDSQHVLMKLGLYEKICTRSYSCSMIELISPRGKSFKLKSQLLTLPRRIFDQLLLNEALAAGAQFLQAHYRGDIEHANGYSTVHLTTPDGSRLKINTRIVFLATGFKGLKILKRSGFNKLARPNLIALRGYCQADWSLSEPLVIFDCTVRHGYYWIFPMGKKLYNVGCVMDSQSQKASNLVCLLDNFLRHNRALKSRGMTSGGRWLLQPRFAMIRTGLSNLKVCRHKNMLLLGETLGTTYPFIGEGIGMAMKSGWIAADISNQALVQHNTSLLEEYSTHARQIIGTQHRPYQLAGRLARINVEGFLSFVSRHAWAQRIITDLVNETLHPGEVFTLQGIRKVLRPGYPQ